MIWLKIEYFDKNWQRSLNKYKKTLDWLGLSMFEDWWNTRWNMRLRNWLNGDG